ncbi:MAG: PAS domain-containing protein [Sporocytophaga sp.]|uniref:PAS domain-containing protein n=1 Tax=Sporocytophaga sp. TaxID=2231183 RepID=UPI001B155EB1|nr:PAS domain-containing protein [Sporocytophaga sp.]MBO9701931.1 PAS domain-containing protein [Sporocytophaga sp.]
MRDFSYKNVKFILFLSASVVFAGFLILQISSCIYFYQVNIYYSAFSTVLCLGGVWCCFLLPILAKRFKEMENNLYENREKYNSIIASSNAGAWEYDSESLHLWCSPEYFIMLGYDVNDLKNEKFNIQNVWIDLLHPDDKNVATKRFTEYLQGGSIGIYENYFRLKHKNGQWIWIWSRGQTLRKPDGSMSSITLGVHIDITEKKNLETKLLRNNDKLLKYAHLNAHEVRGPVARLLGLVELTKLTTDVDYSWIFEKVQDQAKDIDKVLKTISKELNDLEE